MIRVMTSAENAGKPGVETVTNYSGHEAGRVQHGDKCAHRNRQDLSGSFSPECITSWSKESGCPCTIMEPLYMQTSHVGLVLSLREMNGYDDSDFYALVWNGEKGATEEIMYASTRGWTYPNGATIDATPEVRAAYDAYVESNRVAAEARRAAKQAATPERGKILRVVKGRKVPRGLTGECIWIGTGFRGRGQRVGIKDGSGAVHWTDVSNVEVQVSS
jgi:hypothetical protein